MLGWFSVLFYRILFAFVKREMHVLCHNRATMDVFISWSGERSRAAAEALRGWLPKIINAIKPWLSSADINKGARWSTDVASRLETAKAGIICLTPSNLHSDWILFEAGALSKTLKNTFVCPLLFDLEPSDVQPPLAQFQATRATKSELLKLLKTLNAALAESALHETHIDEVFEVWWPKLEHQFKTLPAEHSIAKPSRSERELLEEILALVRNQNRPSGNQSPKHEDIVDPFALDPFSQAVWDAVDSLDPSIWAMDDNEPNKYVFEAEDGRKYTVFVSRDTPLTKIKDVVASQVPVPSQSPSSSRRKKPQK
jgi:TIR domain